MSGKENQAEVKYIANSDYVLRKIAGEFMARM